MLKEFIDFVNSVLPSVSPDFRDGAKNAIAQFEKTGEKIHYLMVKPLNELSQGDILSHIPFMYFDDNGSQKVFVADAFVISTSCNIDNKDTVLLAPVLPLDQFKGDLVNLKKNRIFDYMFIDETVLADKYIAFEYINPYSKNLITDIIDKKKTRRVASLNQIGYYFFVIKLTVYFLRKEDDDTLKRRNIEFGYD